MPTNKQRISAVAATAAIVLAGGWFASWMSPAAASGPDIAETNQAASAPRETHSVKAIEERASSEKAKSERASSGKIMKVSISGIRNSRGKIYVALFDSASAFDSYDYERATAFRELDARSGSISFDFPGLSDKAYAISVFHDENENQEFDMSGGFPSEGYGTSRAKSAYDELKFHQASIKPKSIGIKLYYLE